MPRGRWAAIGLLLLSLLSLLAVQLRLVGLCDILHWKYQQPSIDCNWLMLAYRWLSILLTLRLSPQELIDSVSNETALAFFGLLISTLTTIATVS